MAELPRVTTTLKLTRDTEGLTGTVTLSVPYGERTASQTYDIPAADLAPVQDTLDALADRLTETHQMHAYGVAFEAVAVATRMGESL